MPDLIFVDGRFRVACCLSVILLAAWARTDPKIYGCYCMMSVRIVRYYDEVFEFFDVVESVNTLRVMKIKPDISGSRAMSDVSDAINLIHADCIIVTVMTSVLSSRPTVFVAET